jgi:hypothetical protein
VVPSGNTTFDRLRREAKRLLKDLLNGDEEAIRRFTQYWPATRSGDEARTLVRAQLVVAREHGYRSWAHLKTSLLAGEKRKMTEQRNVAAPERRLGVYTYEEAESLLGISSAQIKKLVEQIEKRPRRYLDAILLEKIWVTAKPFIVTMKRNDGKKGAKEDGNVVQDAILKAGGVLAMDMAQWRFATKDEAECAASQATPVAGYTWIVMELGFEKTMEHLKTVWSDLVARG